MKTRHIFKALTSAFLISLFVSSCSKENLSSPAEDTSDEYVEVALNCTGEIIDMGQTPLSRAGSTDLYYIQVLLTDSVGNNCYYTPYAHGLFDNIDNLKVSLNKKEDYTIQVTMIENAANIIFYDGESYGCPFRSALTNTFTYTSEFDMSLPRYGLVEILAEDEKIYSIGNPNLNRYYGLTYFNPSAGGSINIDMAKMVFGLDVKTENLTEGIIRVKVSDAPEILIDSPNGTASAIFSLYDLFMFYMNDYLADKGYFEVLLVTAEWIDGSGNSHLVAEKPVAFYRNKKTTITVRIDTTPNTGESGINIDIKEPQMEDDTEEDIFEYYY